MTPKAVTARGVARDHPPKLAGVERWGATGVRDARLAMRGSRCALQPSVGAPGSLAAR